MATAEVPLGNHLTAHTQADVCIIGAGVAGLSVAYLLAREGQKVVVLDDGPVGGGMTARTTAHLSNALDDRYFELERLHGEEGAQLACASHTAAIDRIESIVREERISCEFTRLDGYLFTGPRQPKKIIDDEFAASKRAGVPGIEKVSSAPIDSYHTGQALRFPNQGQFHPLRYLTGLVNGILARGGRIYTPAHADKIKGGKQATVTVSGGFKISAGAIVVATNTPINDVVAIHTKQAPYQTYVVAARIPRDAVQRALYWDTLDPYHYVRLQRVGRGSRAYDLLIVGGEDHKTGQKNDGLRRFKALERWARKRFPMMGEIEHSWSGEVMEPADGLAYIGRNPLDADNVFIVTGDSGQGMTHGTIAGILLTDLILGRENPWSGLYDPNRINLRSLSTLAKENLNVAVQYADYVLPADVESVDQIKPGHGAVVSRQGGRVAAYRDEAGKLFERSAVCRHLGCIVNWNGLEKSWDCPCHGSRYDADGQVFVGPANSALPEVGNEDKVSKRSVRRHNETKTLRKGAG
jgi:glycine/D-amino acid oxidase-like deaminating enzyme/nitrite reductase/ring-hydroxylating ferredoxin subunit